MSLTADQFALPDIAHCFQKGHRIVIQVQSTWFPLNDLNPQQFIDITQADEQDFIKSDIKIYHEKAHPSKITVNRLK